MNGGLYGVDVDSTAMIADASCSSGFGLVVAAAVCIDAVGNFVSFGVV